MNKMWGCCCLVAQLCPSLLRLHKLYIALQAPVSIGFLGKNTGVDCHFLLQGIFPTQDLNPALPHCRQKLYRLSPQGSPSGLSGKESTYQCRRHGFNPWVGKIPWRRKWQPSPGDLPGKSHQHGAPWATVHGVEGAHAGNHNSHQTEGVP